MPRRSAIHLLAAALACAFPASAVAHGFGQRYDLPLPLSLYLYGTAAVVVVSFVVVGLFVRRSAGSRGYPRLNLLAYPAGRWIAHPLLVRTIRVVSLALFLLTVAAGFIGDQIPYRNIAPIMIWIVAWVGLAYVSAFVGNLWTLINPWRTAFDWAESLFGRVTGRHLSLRLHYPEALGVWPAAILLLAFAWFELVYPSPAVPAQIALAAVGYSILTWTGMVAFGSEWLRHGEVFSVVFRTYARFAPTQARDGPGGPEVNLRPFGSGLLDRVASPSMTAFVLLLLATVLYDGLLATPEWSSLESTVLALLGGQLDPLWLRSIGLPAFWFLFLGAYLAVSALMSVVADRTTLEIARSFAFTLVPIAIGYHLAHYLVFLLVQGQYVIPLMSDPFGYGWDLFGTAAYRVDITIVGSRFAWYAALTAIVVGHIAAVYLAHVQAMRLLAPRGVALRSQVPLTALMVVYTFVSLSILAEPIVERPAPAQPSVPTAGVAIPADAVLPGPGRGRLQMVGSDKFAGSKLTYRVLGSAFHDGTRMTGADLLYAYVFAYSWGVRGDAGDARYDPLVDAATARMRRHLAGLRLGETDAVSQSFRIADVNIVRELLTIDVYTTVASEEPEQEAVPPWSTLPWHLVVLMEEAVGRGWAAFSRAEAVRRGVEWLDLVRSGQINAQLAALVGAFEREGYRPAALEALVSADAARKRWAALAEFYKAHGHFLVTNGPYRLKRWSAESVTLEAFRDPTYPLGVGSYDADATPRRGYITGVRQDGSRMTLSGDIEIIAKSGRSQQIVRQPLPSVARTVLQRAAPRCRYVVTNDEGKVVLAGTAALAGDSTFPVDLTGKLAAGRYTMAALIVVNGNVMNGDIRRIPVLVP